MNQEQEKAHIVWQRVDAPVPIMFWEPQEFLLSVVFIGFGIVMNSLLVGVTSAAAVLWITKRLKRGAKAGTVPHVLWSLGLAIDPALALWFPKPWQNDFLE